MHRALALVALLAACGCSVREETITKDPVVAAASEAPLLEAKTLSFSYDVSSEVSCSQSYEISTKHADYVLTLTPPHDAKLEVHTRESELFGAQPEIGPGGKPPSPPTSYDRARHDDVLDGVAGRVGDELRIEMNGDSVITLVCKAAKVKVVSYDGGDKHDVDAQALRCTGLALPDELHEEKWGGGVVFGETKAIEAVFETRGMFGEFVVGPELHFAP